MYVYVVLRARARAHPRAYASAGKHFQMHPFEARAPAFAGGPRGGRGFRAGPGRGMPPAARVSVRYPHPRTLRLSPKSVEIQRRVRRVKTSADPV